MTSIWLLTGTSLFFLLACGTRLSAVSDKAQIPQCPAVTSLLELPDMQACRQLMALAEDPWQGCPALRPVVDPESPASRCRHELRRALEPQMHGHFAILSPAFNCMSLSWTRPQFPFWMQRPCVSPIPLMELYIAPKPPPACIAGYSRTRPRRWTQQTRRTPRSQTPGPR